MAVITLDSIGGDRGSTRAIWFEYFNLKNYISVITFKKASQGGKRNYSVRRAVMAVHHEYGAAGDGFTEIRC